MLCINVNSVGKWTVLCIYVNSVTKFKGRKAILEVLTHIRKLERQKKKQGGNLKCIKSYNIYEVDC